MVDRAVVVGSGSIGRRHLTVLRALLPEAALALAPTRPGSAAPPVVAEVGATWLPGPADAVGWGPEVAVVAVPAPFHMAVATELASTGATLLVEKPVDVDLAAVDRFAARAEAEGLVVQVGYCLRFSPSLRALRAAVGQGVVGRPLGVRAEVGQALDTWRPGAELRATVTADAALGGGALFELSHELDLLAWTFGPPEVRGAVLRNLGAHGLEVEESADLLLGWDGLDGTAHLDLVRRPAVRTTTVWGEDGTLIWDGRARTLVRQGPDGAVTTLHGPDEEDVYRAQMTHLLACARGEARPAVTLSEARDVLRVCLEARAADAEGHARG